MDVNELRPINKDVIIRYYDYNKMSGSPILIEDKSTEVTLHYCEVLRVSNNVTLVKEGDIILLSWLNVTPAFEVEVEGKATSVHITTEDHIAGVVEGVNNE